VPIRFVGPAARGPHRADRRAAVPDLGAFLHPLILPPRDSAAPTGGGPGGPAPPGPGDLGAS